jgi:nucleoside diphosphate kinase
MYSGGMKPVIEITPQTKYVFVVVKPGFCKLSQTIIDRFEEAGFTLYKTKTKLLTLREAKQMYQMHKDEDFYDSLCKYMSSDISIGILFTYPKEWKQEKAFKKTEKIKDDIRNEFQESDMRNVMHSSDNIDNMRMESAKYFNELI